MSCQDDGEIAAHVEHMSGSRFVHGISSSDVFSRCQLRVIFKHDISFSLAHYATS